jgi:hypothetical protein
MLDQRGLQVEERLHGGAAAARICFLVPRAAQDVTIASSAGLVRGGSGGGYLTITPGGTSVAVSVRYRL